MAGPEMEEPEARVLCRESGSMTRDTGEGRGFIHPRRVIG